MPNNLFIISGPSGAGKDAVIQGLKKNLPVRQLITTVSRPMREGERQGKPYYFITKKQFKKNIKQNKFFEYDLHYDNYYGLTYEEIKKIKSRKNIFYWQAEYKGVITAKKKMPEITAIFINSPLKILIARMRQREIKLNEKIFKQRIKDTKEWLKHLDIYDYIVDNKQGKLDQTIAKVVKIIKKNSKTSC
jgi:guanylate kinase